MSRILTPGSTLGLLGGGQLGRMFAQAARRMGFEVALFAPEDHPVAASLATFHVRAAYEDSEALEAFARRVDVVTYEFENISVSALDHLEKHTELRPSRQLLYACQERGREKAALTRLGLPVAPHALIESEADCSAASSVGFPGVLKTAAWGYDGKGQQRVKDEAGLRSAWEELGCTRCVYEAWIPFQGELSVIGARGQDGACEFYDPFWNEHSNHILDLTRFPAPIAPETRRAAREIARVVLEGFEVCGVLCVELFHLENGQLMVNEIAPRPHNSGHITLDAHVTCQFEQQVRAVSGLPLGSPAALAPAGAMANLLGDLWSPGEPHWAEALQDPQLRLHLYGKAEARPGRKMGHLNYLAETAEQACLRVQAGRQALVPSE